MRDTLIQALNQLPRRQRAVLLLRIQRRQAFHDIEALTGLPAHTAAGHFHRGLRNLLSQLKVHDALQPSTLCPDHSRQSSSSGV